MKTTAQLLALHEQAQRIIAELSLTEAIRRDAAAIERLRAEAVERKLTLDFIEPQPICVRCQRKSAHCICGLWDHAPTEQEHNAYPSGRYSDFRVGLIDGRNLHSKCVANGQNDMGVAAQAPREIQNSPTISVNPKPQL